MWDLKTGEWLLLMIEPNCSKAALMLPYFSTCKFHNLCIYSAKIGYLSILGQNFTEGFN